MAQAERSLAHHVTTRREVIKDAENLIQNPPIAILILDNFRGLGHKSEQLATNTMLARCAVAATIYYSPIYEGKNKPLLCCFAGKHTPDTSSGSEHVANFLRETFQIPESQIVTGQNTITTTGDITKLHAFTNRLASLGIEDPVAIATTNDHVKRTIQSWLNHFYDHAAFHKKPKLYVLSPSSSILDSLTIGDDCPKVVKRAIEYYLDEELSYELDGNWTEDIATLISISPPIIRRLLEPWAERKTHPHIPSAMKRQYRAGSSWHRRLQELKLQEIESEEAMLEAYKRPQDRW